jgi:hypothetical protein
VYIINMTEENLDISELRFVQETADQTLEYAAIQWQQGGFTGPGSVYQLQPQSCFSVGISVGAASQRPVDCIRVNFWDVTSVSTFWLPEDDSVTEFLVYQGDELIASCPFDQLSCPFALQ